ncbi:hypothetical protein AB0N38_02245 [Micromonospora aurantiaca]|uniref:hypothetical protein n=1 Tax=Micromonospora TaxID=1873 RepID=UPI0024177A27|nr:hypothetical protein [Micromonospora sp. WMMD718]MDG4754607.1 hypothetical protein [Micromonospora sp. WMMD718]
MTSSTDDKQQIGLTSDGAKALERLMREGTFATEGDAYKFSIAYALATEREPADAPAGGYQTKFNASGGLDRDGAVRDLVVLLRPEDSARPYATAEKLAEVGVRSVAEMLETNVGLAEIVRQASEQQVS